MAKHKKRSMNELSRKGKKYHKKRKRSLREGGLSSAFNPSSVTGAGKAMFSGAIGGLLAEALTGKLLDKSTPLARILTLAGVSFGFGAVMKMPNVGAGIAGAIGRELFAKPATMSEAQEVDYITNFPRYLQEGNEAVQLSRGNYMNENTQLSEEDYLAVLQAAQYGM